MSDRADRVGWPWAMLAALALAAAALAAFWFTPLTFQTKQSDTLIGAGFVFAIGMIGALFLNKDGVRTPERGELARKAPAVMGGLGLCLLASIWSEQLARHEVLAQVFLQKCPVALQTPMSARSLGALKDVQAAARAEARLFLVRSEKKDLGNPCV